MRTRANRSFEVKRSGSQPYSSSGTSSASAAATAAARSVYTISSGTSGCAFAAASVFQAVSYVGLLPPTTAGHGGRPSSHAPPRGQQRSAAVAGRNEPEAHE